MKHGSSSRRQRNRGGGGRRGNSNNRAQVFDSNGPDVRIRGTAHQVHEKYMALAKDSAAAGDEILAESYLQHAEHYQRIINEFDAQKPDRQSDKSDDKKERKQEKSSDDDLALPDSITGKEKELEAS